MKELELEFPGKGEVSNYQFRQIKASDHAYVYEISDAYGKMHYEVFKRKERPESETVVQGIKVHFAAKVLYPKAKDFGDWAWCITDYSKAMACYENLNREGQEKTEVNADKIKEMDDVLPEEDKPTVSNELVVPVQCVFDFWDSVKR